MAARKLPAGAAMAPFGRIIEGPNAMVTKKLMLLSGVIAVLGGCGDQTSTSANSATANTSAAASPASDVTRVRGVITAVGTDALTVQTYDGK